MNKPATSQLQKLLTALKKDKNKYVTSEALSRDVGLYPEAINQILAYFDPMVTMDFKYDLKTLIPAIEHYLIEAEAKRQKKPAKPRVSKKVIAQYASVIEFIYTKMTTGGILDQGTVLTDVDLRTLKKLIQIEQNRRKKAK